MAQKNSNIVIEIPHPLLQLRRIWAAIEDIKDPGASLDTINRSTMVFRKAEFQNRIFKAYVRYLRFRVKVLEKKIRDLERE